MKTLIFPLFFLLLSLPAQGKEKRISKTESHKKAQKGAENTALSPARQKPEQTDQKPVQTRAEDIDQSPVPKSDKASDQNPPVSAPGIKSGLITEKIKQVFEDFVEILEKESVQSSEYSKAVRFLENSLYNEASFETLKLLADVYEQKGDLKNQINVLKVLSMNYPKKPESFYFLGRAYKSLYVSEKEEKKKICQSRRSTCRKAKQKKCKTKYQKCLVETKKNSIENFQKSLKTDRKYVPAYEALMELLIKKDPETEEPIHTRESLSLAIDMLKSLRKNKYYVPLCKAYYDNNFLKQSRKACARAVQKNPKDPVGHLIMALSYQEEHKTSQNLLKTAKKFKQSFFVQYQTAFYFMKKDPKTAIIHFISAYGLQPEHLKLNEIMSWFLFDNKEEERSYKHFLNTCQLTEGAYLGEFRKATSALRRKKRPDLALKFKKGIDQCFLEAKKRKKDKK